MISNILDETIKNIRITEYLPYIQNSSDFISKVNDYSGTSLKSSNQLLHSCMNTEEKECLYSLTTARMGWYKRIGAQVVKS